MSKKHLPTVLLLVFLLAFSAVLLVAQIRNQPAGQAAPSQGTVLPDMSGLPWMNTSEPLTPDDLAGKWVVLDLWATWCGPCVASLPELAEFRERWPEQQVMLVGLADNHSPEADIKQAIDRVPGFTWPVAYRGSKVQGSLRPEGLPTLILYDPSGKEVARVAGMQPAGPTSIELLEAMIVVEGSGQ